MKKVINKFLCFFLIITFISSMIMPTVAIAIEAVQPQVTNNEFNNVTETADLGTEQSTFEQTFESSDTAPTEEYTEETPISSTEEEPELEPIEETDQEENVNGLQTELTVQAERASTTNFIDAVVVTEWALYRDKNGVEESLTNDPKTDAVPNQAYEFSFNWTIAADKLGRNLLPGDYFVLEIPQNENRDTGHWYAVSGDWSTVTPKDSSTEIYRYRIENSADGKTQVIRVEFLEGINGTGTNTIDSELEFPGFMNYVTKAGAQNVSFGQDANGAPLVKSIMFGEIALSAANGFSFKYGSAGSNNSLKWGIQFNGAGNIELGGDEVDYNANGGAGNKYQGFYTDRSDRTVWHPWGTNYTDIFAPAGNLNGGELGGYVEDELPAGAEMTSLTIAAYIPIPIGLTQDNYESQTGVYPSSTAAFQSFVLADYGAGPTYRSDSDNSETQQPKVNTGFTLLTQETNETKEQFKKRIQAAPYQYGVYKDASGVATVMMHYGSMRREGNQQQKLSELTNVPNTGRTITNPKSGQTVNITQFAAKAADYCVKRGYYAEQDRELLENYFSITYGDTNAIKGAIASYNISLTVRYPPDTPSGAVKNESAIYTHSALTLNRKEPEAMPKRDGATASLENPYGSITLNANQALLQKFDVERDENDQYIPINGAEFKLQVKDGANKWVDVKKDSDILAFKTDGIQYYEIENGITVEKTVNGLIKVDFGVLGLTNGTYRFVETKAAASYNQNDSPNWDETAQAVVSAEFVIPSTTSRGPTVTVWNKKLPQVKYTVEHYVQKTEGNTAKENFELKETEEKSGYLGQNVVGEPLLDLLNSYEYSAELSEQHGLIEGVVDPDNPLVLKLYYTIAAEVPFTIYKQGMDGEMMPSVDSSGNQLVDEQGRNLKVAFDVYEYVESGKPSSLGEGPKGKPSLWKKVNDAPIKTDALGRLRVPGITTKEELAKYYAIVEVETYPDYVLAYNDPATTTGGAGYREVYWVVRMSDKTIFSTPSWANGTEVDKPEFETPTAANGNRYILKNRKPDISLFKVNEQGEAMPSADQQKVQFDIYRWNGGGYFEENYPYSWSQWTLIESNATTDNQGYFATIGKTGLSGAAQKNFDWYIIREKSTYSGYQKADGYWLVKTAWNKTTQQFEIFEVKYKVVENGTGADGVDPGHEISDDRTELYLTNKAQPISFYKEDGNRNPLGGVHFSLYKVKDGDAGINGSEDPEASDTKWDMAHPTEKISSMAEADKGKVTFENLPRGDYLLVETQTLPGYQLPLGSWIITINSYGEIETIRGRGDPLPPAFRIDNGIYYLANYRISILPESGGYGKMAMLVLGIVLVGSAIWLATSKSKKNTA